MRRDLNAPKFCMKCRRVKFMSDWIYIPEKDILNANHLWQVQYCNDVMCETWDGEKGKGDRDE